MGGLTLFVLAMLYTPGSMYDIVEETDGILVVKHCPRFGKTTSFKWAPTLGVWVSRDGLTPNRYGLKEAIDRKIEKNSVEAKKVIAKKLWEEEDKE